MVMVFLTSIMFNYNSYAISSSPYVKEFVHTFEIREYGLTVLTSTISFHNNLTSKVTVPIIEIKYPKEMYQKMVIESISDKRLTPASYVEGNFTIIKLVPENVIQIDPDYEYNITVKILVKEFFSFTSSTTIQFILPIYPALNLDSGSVSSNIILPYGVVPVETLENFTYTALATKNIYNRTFENVKAGNYYFKNTSAELIGSANLYLLKVPKAVRTIQFYDDGGIWVMEEIQLKNLGETSLSTLSLSILNDRLLSVKLVRDIGPETDYDLGLYRQFTLPQQLNRNETYTLKIRYPAPSNITRFIGNSYIINITTTPPLDTLVEEYVIKVQPSQGFNIVSSENVKVVKNAYFDKQNFVIEYVPKLYWSSSTYIPISLLILIIFASITPLLKKEVEEEKRYVFDLKAHVRGKLKLVESIIELYEGRLKGQVPRQRFNILKQEYFALSTKANSNIANSIMDAIKNDPQNKPVFDRISLINREVDTMLKQLTSYYDQLNIGKLNRSEFEKMRSDIIKRINSLKQEIESELEKI
ncbi:MAG: hypothetical protein N3F64_03840 [Nitrososphaeria archaeon]|nr:hypothetical protein [Nitrososphaeria archaeon]